MLDIIGKRFGHLTVMEQKKRERLVTKRLCRCDCGKLTWLPTTAITSGHTKSCGCWQGEFRKLKTGEAVRNQIFDDYRRGAGKRNLLWALTKSEFDLLLLGNCVYCKRAPYTTRKARRMNGDLTYNGIDRLNNILGYSPENTVSCCKICNRAKSDLELEEFMEWIKDISKAQR
jgi:hypothetical protein